MSSIKIICEVRVRSGVIPVDSPTVLIAEKTSMPISAKENGSIALIIRIAAKIAAR